VTSEQVVVTDAQNAIAGFAYHTASAPYIVSTVGSAVHPDYWGQGTGELLAEWAEARAHEFTQRAPAGVRTVLEAGLFEVDREAIRLYRARGFVRVREWMHLVVELDAPPPQPTLADHLVLREMDLDRDWEIVDPAMDEAFADHWGPFPLLSQRVCLPKRDKTRRRGEAVGRVNESVIMLRRFRSR
jgi:hypothetical protein